MSFDYIQQEQPSAVDLLLLIVTVRHMYAATAVSAKGQFQGAVPSGSCQVLRPGQTDSLRI
jgi:hypothetical protein